MTEGRFLTSDSSRFRQVLTRAGTVHFTLAGAAGHDRKVGETNPHTKSPHDRDTKKDRRGMKTNWNTRVMPQGCRKKQVKILPELPAFTELMFIQH